MVKKYRKNRASDSLITNDQRLFGTAKFFGAKKAPGCALAVNQIPKSFLLVGELVELECETPLEEKVDSFKLLNSTGTPVVVASGDGKYIMVVSANTVKEHVKINPENQLLKDAINLHAAFHGTDFDKIKKVDTKDTEVLVFWGHLNHIVYSVPQYSERRGVPFIHEAKDRGDDEAPADQKPIVCVSPNRDFLVMYGPQFIFTERGMIG